MTDEENQWARPEKSTFRVILVVATFLLAFPINHQMRIMFPHDGPVDWMHNGQGAISYWADKMYTSSLWYIVVLFFIAVIISYHYSDKIPFSSIKAPDFIKRGPVRDYLNFDNKYLLPISVWCGILGSIGLIVILYILRSHPMFGAS